MTKNSRVSVENQIILNVKEWRKVWIYTSTSTIKDGRDSCNNTEITRYIDGGKKFFLCTKYHCIALSSYAYDTWTVVFCCFKVKDIRH